MHNFLLISWLTLFSYGLFAQNNDYSIYHKNVNTAEELYFMKSRVDSALCYYDKTFNEFDFIFVKDLINAAQIAKFNNKPFVPYIEKGFKQGLKISHLKNYPLLKDYYETIKNDKKFIKKFDSLRKEYLKKIDFDYLNMIYQLAIKDQINKHNKTSQYQYWRQVKKITDRIKDSIKTKGFPGDKIIGISDSTIFKEIGKPHLDLYPQRNKHKKLWYMTSDEKYLIFKYSLIIYLHNPCSYNLYDNLLKEEIKKGNVHPRDIGLLNDHVYSYRKNLRNGCDNSESAFALHNYANYSKNLTENKINKLRESYFIVPIEIDRKKKEFEEKYGFNLFSGVWNSR